MPFVVSIEYNATVAGEGLLYDGQALKVTRPIDGGPLLFFLRVASEPTFTKRNIACTTSVCTSHTCLKINTAA